MNIFSSESHRLYLWIVLVFANLSDIYSGSYSFTVLNIQFFISLVHLSARLVQFLLERISHPSDLRLLYEPAAGVPELALFSFFSE